MKPTCTTFQMTLTSTGKTALKVNLVVTHGGRTYRRKFDLEDRPTKTLCIPHAYRAYLFDILESRLAALDASPLIEFTEGDIHVTYQWTKPIGTGKLTLCPACHHVALSNFIHCDACLANWRNRYA